MSDTARAYPAATGVSRRGSLADEVAVYIRHLVLTGVLRPGERVDQEAVSEALDVSRSPIREAVVVLGQEGLLTLSRNRGAFVADITPGDIAEHYELFGAVSGRRPRSPLSNCPTPNSRSWRRSTSASNMETMRRCRPRTTTSTD